MAHNQHKSRDWVLVESYMWMNCTSTQVVAAAAAAKIQSQVFQKKKSKSHSGRAYNPYANHLVCVCSPATLICNTGFRACVDAVYEGFPHEQELLTRAQSSIGRRVRHARGATRPTVPVANWTHRPSGISVSISVRGLKAYKSSRRQVLHIIEYRCLFTRSPLRATVLQRESLPW